MLSEKKIGFIGAGSMAEAIIGGLLYRGEIRKRNISIINRNDRDRLKELELRYQLSNETFDQKKIEDADIIILATKPKDLPEALKFWGNRLRAKQLVISVAAGISTQYIESFLNRDTSVIRTMPNTSSSVGCSATALCVGNNTTDQDLELARHIFSAIGSVVEVDETLMDAVTGLSGSGPAYFYYMVEAMEQAGVKAGLALEDARSLTIQTLLGAAQMLTQTGKDAKQLRQEVTSPNGTTMAGLDELHKHSFEHIVQRAVLQAKKRSQEIGMELIG